MFTDTNERCIVYERYDTIRYDTLTNDTISLQTMDTKDNENIIAKANDTNDVEVEYDDPKSPTPKEQAVPET